MDENYTTQDLIPIYSDSTPPKNFTFILIFSAFVIILGSFQFGYTIGVLNIPKESISNIKKISPPSNSTGFYFKTESECDPGVDVFLKPCIQMKPFEWNFFVGSFLMTSLIGGLVGGPLSDYFGRKFTLYFANIFFIVGSIFCSFFSEVWTIILGRFITGFGVGLVMVSCPVYLAEISPSSLRGGISSLHQLSICTAILFSQVLGIWLSSRPEWRFLFVTQILIALTQIVLLTFVPQSPKWLYNKGMLKESRNSLSILRSSPNIEEEFETLTNSNNEEPDREKEVSSEPFYSKYFKISLMKPFLLCSLLHFVQQFSGINAIIFYSTQIFQSAGLSENLASLATLGVGLTIVVSTAISVMLIDRFGRKLLLISSEIFALLSLSILAISFILNHYDILPSIMRIIMSACVMIYLAGFSIGLGPVPWVVMGEMFPPEVSGIYCSIVTCWNLILTLLIALLFEPIDNLIKPFTFVAFAAITFICTILSILFLPETKGKTIDEITRQFENK